MRKVSIIIFLLLFFVSTHAATIYEVPKDKGIFRRAMERVVFCKWRISCYWQERLGAAITTIAATDIIRDSRATINTNFTNLNTDKTEVSTTSVGNITALPNQVTTGTLTAGSLGSGFTTVVVARGGTGSTTLSQHQVLIGSSTNAVGVVSGLGTSGQFLTSGGAGTPPTWTTGAVDQALSYNWTAPHTFTQINSIGTSTLATTTVYTSLVGSTIIATSTNASGFGTTTPAGQVAIETNTNRFPLFIGDKGTTSPLLVLTGQGRLGIGTSTPLATTTIAGHIQFGGNRPALSGCGTAPSNVGNDVAGTVTIGSVATECTVTFASSWTNNPACTANNESAANAITRVDVNTGSFTVSFTTDPSSQVFNYICIGFE